MFSYKVIAIFLCLYIAIHGHFGSKQYNELSSDYDDLEDRYNELSSDFDYLEDRYNELQVKLKNLDEDYY
tara:strand:+ start:246 stop:455 length:210 start_codon:yes stop_codon:yes gene_type:complete